MRAFYPLFVSLGLLAIAALFPALAMAAEVIPAPATSVVVPYGEWIKGIGDTLEPFVVTAAVTFLTGLVGTVAWPMRIFLSNALIDRMVRTAIDFAINAVNGAVKGGVISVPLGSTVIATAVQRAVDSTPAWIVKAAGGPEGIAKRVFRTLHLENTANAANTLEPALSILSQVVPANPVGK